MNPSSLRAEPAFLGYGWATMQYQGHNIPLSEEECRALVRGGTVGRVGWVSAAGMTVQPVIYRVRSDQTILFRTGAGTMLSELVAGMEACFQVDDLDQLTRTGWSVLIRGTASEVEAGPQEELPEPWAPGDRPVLIAIVAREYTGRAVFAG